MNLHHHIESQLDRVIFFIWMGTLGIAEITPDRCPAESIHFKIKLGLEGGKERRNRPDPHFGGSSERVDRRHSINDEILLMVKH